MTNSKISVNYFYAQIRELCGSTLEKFWSCVRRTPAESVQLVPEGELVAEAEVCYLDVQILVQKQIFGLERQQCVNIIERDS